MPSSLRRSAFLASGLAAAVAPRIVAAQSAPLPLRIGANAGDSFGEAYYAHDMGFFAKAGIDATVTAFANGGAMAQAVIGGALDVAVSSVISLANATIHGVPLAYLAAGGLYDTNAPTIVLCVAKDAPYRDVREFEGKAIGVIGLKDITNLAALEYLRKGGADVSKIQFIETPLPTTAAVLKRGTVAAAIVSEPILSDAADDIRVFGKAFDAIAKRLMIGGWFATADWTSRNRELAKRFSDVMLQTARWANANHQQSAVILQKYGKFADATISRMTRVTYAESLDPALIEPTLVLAAQEKFTDRLVPARDLIANLEGHA
jgi:NitT/TauT family transport system substrate-binding protein